MSKKKKIQDMLEAHLDKIILGLIGVISFYLLWALVLGNPYGVKVDGRKLGPGEIDTRNKQQAQTLLELLNDPADPVIYDQKLTADFENTFRCTLPYLTNLMIPYPGIGEQVFDENRVYPTPEIVALSDVQIASLRGAVHKPTEEIGPDSPYSLVMTELGDLDFVTDSGKLDIQALYRNFQQSFMGPRLNASWREPAFARPVFARLELQRRERLANGSWGEWTVVPRTQIDSFRKLFEQTPMTTEQMEFGGVMMWIKQYEDSRVQASLLQPVAYDFASTLTSWLPPKYLDEAEVIIKKQGDELKRQIREERLRARTARTEDTPRDMMLPGGGGRQPARDRTPTRPQPQPRPQRGGREVTPDNMMADPFMGAPQPARPTAATRRERTLEDIQRDMQKDRIDEKTKLESLRDPALVWAHDDTAQPGSTYQYRIRLGVFNPIAGRDWFSDEQKHFKNQVVLWSNFSEPTKEVYIPKMMHLFPTEVLAKEAAGGVKVDVAKYYLGQWRTHEFEIFPGQIIGESIEESPKTTAANPATGLQAEMMMMDPFAGGGTTKSSGPMKVDYSTPYMMVDINSRVDWGVSLNNRTEFSQILYYGPESVLQALAIGKNNWPAEMRREYADIKDSEQNSLPLNMSRTTMPGIPMDLGRRGGIQAAPGTPGGNIFQP